MTTTMGSSQQQKPTHPQIGRCERSADHYQDQLARGVPARAAVRPKASTRRLRQLEVGLGPLVVFGEAVGVLVAVVLA